MRRRRLLFVVATASALLAALFLLLFAAWRHVPGFYQNAVRLDPAGLSAGSNELLQRAAALSSDARRQGDWEALFTAAQINGWLAVDMPRNHPDLLPAGFRDPRVSIANGQVCLACRWGDSPLAAIFSVKLGVQMIQPHVLAIRVDQVRAGLLPVPQRPIIETISDQARRLGTPIHWRRVGDDPVAIIRLPPFQQHSTLFVIQNIEFRDQHLFVAGQTESAGATPLAIESETEPRAATVGQLPKADTTTR